MKQKTMIVGGQKVKVRIRRRTHLGNHLGWTVRIGEARYDFFILSPQEAQDKAIAKYLAATAVTAAGDAQGGGADAGGGRGGDGLGGRNGDEVVDGGSAADDAELRKAMATQISAAKERYESTLAAFLAAVQRDPIDAVIQRSEDMTRARAVHDVWRTIEWELASHGPREVLAENLNVCRDRVWTSVRGRTSGGAIACAVERAWAEALARQVDLLEELARRFGI